MQQRLSTQDRFTLMLERLVWNAAAGAALAVMILVLLGSLRWLDAVAPSPAVPPAAVAAPAAGSGPASGDRLEERAALVDPGPSG